MSQERRFCVACGRPLGSGAAFCAECGLPTGQAGAPVAAAPAPPAPASPGPPAQAPFPAPATARKRRPTLLFAVAALAAVAVVAAAYFTVLKKDGVEDISYLTGVSVDENYLYIYTPKGWKTTGPDINRLIIYKPGASTGWDAPVSGGPRIRIEAPRPAATGAALDAAALSAAVAAAKSGEFRVIEEAAEVEVIADHKPLKGTAITYQDHGVTVRFVSFNFKGQVFQIFLEAPASLWPGAGPVLEQAFGSVYLISSSTAPAPPATAAAAPPSRRPRIGFVSDRDGNLEIYVMNDDGSGQTRLTNNSYPDQTPAWSPDGRRVAFAAAPDGKTLQIHVMNADGTGLRKLTSLSSSASSPVWTPDGARLVFNNGSVEVDTMGADGSGLHKLADVSYGGRPSVSPDGRRILLGNAYGAGVIADMSADGSSLVFLAKPAHGSGPSWSPDGRRIVFYDDRDGNLEIYVMNADGSGQTRLTNNPGRDLLPQWSPDGRRIVFASDRDGNYEIYIMNADGSGQTRLTNNAATDGQPVWLP